MLFIRRFGRQWKAGKYGYALGGASPNVVVADRTTFSTRTTAANSASNLTAARSYITGLTDSCRFGYSIGGRTTVAVATADCTTLSTSATAALTSANLVAARYGAPGVSSGARYGYVLGGSNDASIETIDFSTQATSTLAGVTLSVGRVDAVGLSDGVRYGYVIGGGTAPSPSAVADRMPFASRTISAVSSANLSAARTACGACAGPRYGYIVGGVSTALGGAVLLADEIDFDSSVTSAQSSANLDVARYYKSGLSDGRQYGYFMGGAASTALSSSITFATRTMGLCATAALSAARYGSATFADYNV
jgi:hypothetical protein